MVSFYPQLSAPTGNRHLGIGSGSTELFVPFQAARHFCDDRLLVYGELGYHLVFDTPEANRWRYGLAGQWQVREGLVSTAGRVGLWIKADSVTYFDDLKVASLDRD
jgi:hypothetical protein